MQDIRLEDIVTAKHSTWDGDGEYRVIGRSSHEGMVTLYLLNVEHEYDDIITICDFDPHWVVTLKERPVKQNPIIVSIVKDKE